MATRRPETSARSNDLLRHHEDDTLSLRRRGWPLRGAVRSEGPSTGLD
jgi:hypothetical protein